MDKDIKRGDLVELGFVNGLGLGLFKVLKVEPQALIHPLCVRSVTGGRSLWAMEAGVHIVKHANCADRRGACDACRNV